MSKEPIELTLMAIFLSLQLLAQTEEVTLFENHLNVPELEHSNQTNSVINFRSTESQSDFDITFYELNIEVFPQTEEITGQTTIHAKSLTNNLQQIDINLYDNMEIDSIRQGTSHLPYSRFNHLVTIQLNNAINNGDYFVLEIYYKGNPAEGDPERWRWETQINPSIPVIYSLSSPYGASTWWPCKDNLNDKADSVAIKVTVPANLVVASNGLLVETIDNLNGTHTFNWKTNYPIAAYLVSVAISEYAILTDEYVSAAQDTLPLQYFVYPQLVNLAQIDFANIPEMIAFYASILDEYPFFNEKYGVALAPFPGALENQTITTYSHWFIDGTLFWEFVLAHELSHHWFGDCVTMKSWSEVWLSEGFATYCHALWIEHTQGQSAYLELMDQFDPGHFSGTVFVHDTTHFDSLFSGTVYYKGAWVLHMLRKVLGDENFFNCLYSFANHPDFKYKAASTDDFREVCETTSNLNLDWFFEQWIYRKGRPHYLYHWENSGTGPYQTTLHLEQEDSLTYKMPIEIQLSNGQSDTTITVWDSLQVQDFSFSLEFEPMNLTIDPEGWLLKKVSYSPNPVEPETDESPATQFSLHQNYPNPFNPVTTIEYVVQPSSRVELKIYNTLGQLVKTLVDDYKTTGEYSVVWDGTDSSGKVMPSGNYFYQIKAGELTSTKKMIYIK